MNCDGICKVLKQFRISCEASTEQLEYLMTVLENEDVNEEEKIEFLISVIPDLEAVDMSKHFHCISEILFKYQESTLVLNESSLNDTKLPPTTKTSKTNTSAKKNTAPMLGSTVFTCTSKTNPSVSDVSESVTAVATDCVRSTEMIPEEQAHVEDISFLCELFPQITPEIMLFLYQTKFSCHKNATAEYLFELIYDPTAPGDSMSKPCTNSSNGEVESDYQYQAVGSNSNSNSDEKSYTCEFTKITASGGIEDVSLKLKQMMIEYEEKVALEEKQKYSKQKQINEVILKKYSERVVIPKYDDKGNEIRPKFHPRNFLGYSSLKDYKKSKKSMPTKFDTSLTKVRFIDNQAVTHTGEKEITLKNTDPNASLYNGPLRGKENKGSLAKAAKAKAAKQASKSSAAGSKSKSKSK